MMVVDGLLVQTCLMVAVVGFVIGFALTMQWLQWLVERKREKRQRKRLELWKAGAQEEG